MGVCFIEDRVVPNTLILVGIFGIQDPLRDESRHAVYCTQNAGIVSRMITGDSIDTATYISKSCGIVSSASHRVVDGTTFRRKYQENAEYREKNAADDPEFIEFITSLRVIARCQPHDKVLLVNFLQKSMDRVVCVTGDGSNDGPALRTATVGLAMGISGTDVAKYAADIILLDDNFTSLVRAVIWGRSILNNIQKFCQFQLTIACTILVTIFFTTIVHARVPFTAIQLLYTNLIVD
uniref:Calcium-transporting ATPase 2, plasma membrane-type n=1 Tax=Lygus hesperus TaxID=30085 RepID=A0A0A9Z2P2_LYGHE